MRKRRFGLFLLFAALTLSGCGPDLGIYDASDGYEKLYAAFSDMETLYDGGSKSYDFEDSLLNEKTINEFSWKDEDDAVQEKEYLYLILPVEKDQDIEAIILFFKSPETKGMEFSSFYFPNEDAAPKKIKYLSSPDTEPEYDDDGNYIGEKEIEYDDPSREVSLAGGSLSLAKEEWDSFVFGGFQQAGYEDNLLHVKEDGLIYLRIENNSGFNRETLQSVQFSFMNLLIRAV